MEKNVFFRALPEWGGGGLPMTEFFGPFQACPKVGCETGFCLFFILGVGRLLNIEMRLQCIDEN